MQARGRFVEHQQSVPGAAGIRFGEMPGELQPLGLAAAECRHGLPQREIIETDLRQRREPGQHRVLRRETRDRLGNGEFQHFGNRVAVRESDLQHFGTKAPPVTLRTTQVHIAQELHLDVFETTAVADRTAAIPGIEAEGSRGVAALACQRRGTEQLAYRTPGTDVAGRVGARALADRRLVHQHHIRQVLHAAQHIMAPGGITGFAERLARRVDQHIADQCRFAGAADPGHAHQLPERNAYIDGLEIVFADTVQFQRCAILVGWSRHACDTALAPQPGGGQRARRIVDRGGLAEKHQLPAGMPRAGAHIENPVGGQHQLRVVLDHQQRIPGITQTAQHRHHLRHVTRMQSDARLVEHEQGIHQRGAERRGQVDPLHLATAQRARLAIQRQVPDPYLDQETQPRTDLGQHHRAGFVEPRGQADGGKKCFHPLDRQGTKRGEIPPGSGVIGRALQAPQQRIGLEPRTVAVAAPIVAAVFRQQHPDMHPVTLRFEPGEEASHPVPDTGVDLAFALDHPCALLRAHILPGHIEPDPALARITLQVVLAFAETLGLPGLDRALAQGACRIRYHQAVIDTDGAPESTAGLAGADRRIEGKRVWRGFLVGDIAPGAVQSAGEAQLARRIISVLQLYRQLAPPQPERGLETLAEARAVCLPQPQAVLDHHQRIAKDADPGITLRLQQLRELLRAHPGQQLHGKADQRNRLRACLAHQRLRHAVGAVALHQLIAPAAVKVRGPREQQLQIIVELGHGADCRARGAHRVGLVDRDRRRNAAYRVDLGLVHALEKLPRIGREGLDIAALTFRVNGVESQRGLARAADACHHQ